MPHLNLFPEEILSYIFHFLPNENLEYVRQTNRLFLRLIEDEIKKRSLKKTVSLKSFAGDVEEFLEKIALEDKSSGSKARKEIFKNILNLDVFEKTENFLWLRLYISDLYELESKKYFFKNTSLLKFYQESFKLFNTYATLLNEATEKSELPINTIYRIYGMMRPRNNTIIYKGGLKDLADTLNEGRINILKDLADFFYKEAVRYIPQFVDTLYKCGYTITMHQALFVSRTCYFNNSSSNYHRWKFYLSPSDNGRYADSFYPNTHYFKQLSELWPYRTITGDLFCKFLAHLKVAILSHEQFDKKFGHHKELSCLSEDKNSRYNNIIVDLNELYESYQVRAEIEDGMEIDITQFGLSNSDDEYKICNALSW